MRLPHVTAASELGGDIQHRIRDLRDDIVPQQSWAVIDVEFVGSAGAEIPCFAGLASEWTSRRKERTNLCNDIACLIQFKQRRTCPALGGAQSDKDPHVRAALV